jgi:hypothetical protein
VLRNSPTSLQPESAVEANHGVIDVVNIQNGQSTFRLRRHLSDGDLGYHHGRRRQTCQRGHSMVVG